MVRKSYNIAISSATDQLSGSSGNAPLAEVERADTPDMEAVDKKRKGDNRLVPDIITKPGAKCYWFVAALVGLVCLALVLVLALVSALVIQDDDRVVASSRTWQFSGARLTAYPRLRDNPADSSEIVICDKTVDEIIGSSDALLMEYNVINETDYRPCSEAGNGTEDKPCRVETLAFSGSTCSSKQAYGFKGPTLSPCFFLRIEDSGDWVPEDLDNSTITNDLASRYHPDFVTVVCKSTNGEPSVPVKVEPSLGFPKYYFPRSKFDNSTKYLPPLISVQIEQPPAGVDISIECQVRVKNTHELQFEGKAGIRFRILENVSDCNAADESTSTTGGPAGATSTEDPVQGRNPDPVDLGTDNATTATTIVSATNSTTGMPTVIHSTATSATSTGALNDTSTMALPPLNISFSAPPPLNISSSAPPPLNFSSSTRPDNATATII